MDWIATKILYFVVELCTDYGMITNTQIPYSTKHWWEKTLADLAVDSRSAKVLSANLLFHHDYAVQINQSAKVLCYTVFYIGV